MADISAMSGMGSLVGTLYNDSYYKRNKDLGYGILGKFLGNMVDERFSNAQMRNINNMNIRNWQMQNEYDKHSIQRAVAGAREAGINPISAIGETSSFQAGAVPSPSTTIGATAIPTSSPMLDTSSLAQLPLIRAQVRKMNADAEAVELSNQNERSYNTAVDRYIRDNFIFNQDNGTYFGTNGDVLMNDIEGLAEYNRGVFNALNDAVENKAKTEESKAREIAAVVEKCCKQLSIDDPKIINAMAHMPVKQFEKLTSEISNVNSQTDMINIQKRMMKDNNIYQLMREAGVSDNTTRFWALTFAILGSVTGNPYLLKLIPK